MNALRTYQAPWGVTLITTSSVLLVLAVVNVVASSWLIGKAPWGVAGLVQWTLPVLVLVCLPFVIRGYVITEDAILVKRLCWTTRLARADLKSAEVVPNALRKSLRTCGNGGAFSFSGWYWSKSLGHYRAFVTDLKRTVVLRFKNRAVVLSPARPEDFVRDLNL
ncbi:MAG: PH domain-containing protein [Verrucomicrobia bacterium]|nr:PH domain-containing protein [Verrucomicrobiota bacterium]